MTAAERLRAAIEEGEEGADRREPRARFDEARGRQALHRTARDAVNALIEEIEQ